MVGFKCKHCGFDLSLRIDLLARALEINRIDVEQDFPKDLAIDGCCDECKTPFCFSGEMFSKFLAMKVEEGVIDPRTENFAIFEFDVNEEEAEVFRQLLKEGDKKKLTALITKLLIRDGRPDKED
jgi:hypothetical protein